MARQFDLMADLLEIRGENPFRVRAYRRASLNLQSLPEDVAMVTREGRLDDIPGIGADLAGEIAEYLRTGRVNDLDVARKGIPAGVVELMGVPGIGPKTARLLFEKEGVTGVARLEALARTGQLRGLPDAPRDGPAARPGARPRPRGRAGGQAGALAGSIRRMRETVGDIDLLVTSTTPARVIEAFVALPRSAGYVTNAREAMPDGGQIRVETGLAPGRPERLRLVVTDTGPGIAAADLPHLFEPFFTTKPAGTGLGLAITYGIVQDHHGTIDVHSAPGQGATFTLAFPALDHSPERV